MAEDVYAVPVIDLWLVHAPFHKISALVNYTAVSRLKNGRSLPIGAGGLGDLLGAFENELGHLPKLREGPLCPEFLGLVPTRNCNLACVYCSFGALTAPESRMDLKMAAAAVDWMAAHMQGLGKHEFELHFFGGEPFFAGDVVAMAVHRAHVAAAQRGMKLRLEVCTNGVVSEEWARFIGDYFDTVVLSFDGPAEIQDRYRPISSGQSSFEAVNRTARSLSQSPTELCFRMCVTQETVTHLEEISCWFCENYQPSIITFEPLQPTPQSVKAGLQAPDPFEFARHFICASRQVKEHGIRPVYAASMKVKPRFSFCPVGNDTLIISPDGQVNACYLLESEWKARSLDMNVGHFSLDGTMHLDSEAVRRLHQLVTNKPRCRQCFCQWSCAGGCHVNHAGLGFSRQYDDFCIRTRLIMACSLLSDLGQEILIDRLLDDQSAMNRLVFQASDLLKEWEGKNDRST